MKKKVRTLDLTDHGPIWDVEDGIDYSGNFSRLLAELFCKRTLPAARTKIRFLVEYFDPEDVARYRKEKTYSFGYLRRLYKEWFKKDFELENHKKEERWDDENYEREFRQRSAWGQYVQVTHTMKLIAQEKEVQSLSRSEQAAKRKEFEKENGPVVMYIG